MFQRLCTCYQTVRRSSWDSGTVCAAVACIVVSFSALQVKLTGGRVPVLELCVIRASMSFCTSMASATAAGIKPLYGHKQRYHLLLLRGLFGTLAISSRYVALLTLPLGDAVTIAQMRPPITSVVAWLLLGEPLGAHSIAGFVLSVLGVMVLIEPPFLFGGQSDWSRKHLLGIFCGLSATLCASGASYCIRRIKKSEAALTVAIWFHTTAIALVAGPLLLGILQEIQPVAPRDWLLLGGISTTSFVGQLLATRALQLLPAARATAMSFMGVVYSHILGSFFFDEKLTASTVAGGVLILLGVLLVTMRKADNSTGNHKGADVASGLAYAAVPTTDSGAPSNIAVLVAAPDGEAHLKAVDTLAVAPHAGSNIQLGP